MEQDPIFLDLSIIKQVIHPESQTGEDSSTAFQTILYAEILKHPIRKNRVLSFCLCFR